MDFLATALYSRDDGLSNLVGAVLTHFDPDDITGRAKRFYVTRDQLLSGENLQPRGFMMNESDGLLSDTHCRKVFDKVVTDYIQHEVSDNDEANGLIDIVLQAVASNAKVLIPPKSVRDSGGKASSASGSVETISLGGAKSDKTAQSVVGSDIENAEDKIIEVPMRAFKVSNSSFNIYAPYQIETGEFRTISLIDIQSEEETIPFVLSIPEEDIEKFERFSNYFSDPPEWAVKSNSDAQGNSGYKCYLVDAPLCPAKGYAGEGFINFLAYSVAFYTIGLTVVGDFLADTKFVSSKAPTTNTWNGTAKRPLRNVSIKAICGKACTQKIVSVYNDTEKLKELVSENTDAYITYCWVSDILRSANEKTGDWRDRVQLACIGLQYEAKLLLLKYSLELLSQRYLICEQGFIYDTLPDVLHGGGVAVDSIKKFVR